MGRRDRDMEKLTPQSQQSTSRRDHKDMDLFHEE